MNELRTYLKKGRTSRGLSQAEAARQLRERTGEDVAAYYINKLEQGVIRQPNIERLRRLCEVYGLDLEGALQAGEYPGHGLIGQDNIPPFMAARLRNMSPRTLQALDDMWPIIEQLLGKIIGQPLDVTEEAVPASLDIDNADVDNKNKGSSISQPWRRGSVRRPVGKGGGE